MRVLTSFATLCAISSAVAIEQSEHLNQIVAHPQDDTLADYSYQRHIKTAGNIASSKKGGPPSPNFNKKVYHFEEKENIFDQKDYEERVRSEADLMIALEALKQSIVYSRDDVNNLRAKILSERSKFQTIGQATTLQMQDLAQNLQHFSVKRDKLFNEAAYSQHELDDNMEALVLYCHQFAFAPKMIGPCAKLLSCGDKELHYNYTFPSNYSQSQNLPVSPKRNIEPPQAQPEPVYRPQVQEQSKPTPMQSTHGYPLNEVGGHVPVMPGTEPELAAAAITPTEVVVQQDGRTYVAPIDKIDPDKVELACNLDGCALIPDDRNP